MSYPLFFTKNKEMIKIDKIKVLNFLQDFGCAKLGQLQILFNDRNNNFKNVLDSNMVSKKGDVYIHNTKRFDEKTLIALDILCKYKPKLLKYSIGYSPVVITFTTKDNISYHVIVANQENKKGVVKIVNTHLISLPKADKLILAFPDKEELDNIECEIPYVYTTYPNYEILKVNI